MKDGDQEMANNHSPISLLSVLSRICESFKLNGAPVFKAEYHDLATSEGLIYDLIMILKFGVRHDIQFASEKYSHNYTK